MITPQYLIPIYPSIYLGLKLCVLWCGPDVIEFAKNDNMVCDEILMFVQAPNLQGR
jgi:hypothetical protein